MGSSNEITVLPASLHVFSHEQIRQLLKTASRSQERSISPETLHSLLLVLSCTGLRPGEAVRLRVGDVDLANRVFFIRESKGKSRWVPFGGDLARKLQSYGAPSHTTMACPCRRRSRYYRKS
jgi:integrase/recombinase XerD